MRYILFFLALSAWADIITVCASGCDETDPQAAFTAAVGGDIIELKAGETFEGAYTLPYRTSGGEVLVRTSKWRELPPVGTRVTTAHVPLMAKLRVPDSSSAVITAGYTEQHVSSVNLGTDVITFSGSHNIPNDSPFVCRVAGGTAPLTEYTVYWARDVSGATMKVAATRGGAALDLTTALTATTFRCTRNDSIKGWKFQGIEFSGKVGSPSQYNLILIGGDTMERSGIPANFAFDRVYIHGIQDENGAKNCLIANAKNISITDSRIEFCQREGEEAHGISAYLTPSMYVRNNYIAAGSINMLIGGAFVFTPDLVNGDDGGIVIIGNHFHKPLYLKYRQGTGETGVPAGACTDDALRLRTTTGQLYKCTSNTWNAVDCANDEYYRRTDVTQTCVGGACWKCASNVYIADTVYRAGGYFAKNLFEIKSAMNTLIEGNIFENNWASNGDQSGIAVWVTSQVDQNNANGWVRGENITFRRNIIKNSDHGIRVTTDGSYTFGIENNRIAVVDNVGIGIGTTAYPSIANTGSGLQVGGACVDCTWSHNTMYPGGAGGGNGMQFDTSEVTRLYFANNLTARNTYGVRGTAGGECSGITADPVVIDGDDILANNALVDQLADGGLGSIGACATNTKYVAGPWTTHVVDGAAGNLRLKTTSPYSKACSSGCDFAGVDDKDLGADIDIAESTTCGAVSGLGCLGQSIKMDIGSTRAIIKYNAPSASSCNLILYTDIGRVTEHGDTNTGGEKADSRTGNITNGVSRQFVLGTNTALTASTKYWFVATCGTSVGYGEFTTRAAGSGSTYRAIYNVAKTAQYSSNADMSSPTSVSSGTTHSIPISAASVVYYRPTGGLITALVTN